MATRLGAILRSSMSLKEAAQLTASPELAYAGKIPLEKVVTLSRMERTHDVLEIRVQGTKRFEPKLLARLQEIANKREGAHLKLRVITELISQLD